jgi:hypothetical protein
MATQDECIKNLLNTTKYNLYYKYYGASAINLLNKIVAFGKITKYQVWKRIFNHLSSSSYGIFSLKDTTMELKILLNLLDDKLSLGQNEYNKLIDYLIVYVNYEQDFITEMSTELCRKYGICNHYHFWRLIRDNKNKKIDKLHLYIQDFLRNNVKIENDYKYSINISSEILYLLTNDELCNLIFVDDKSINNFINKMHISLRLFYDFHEFDSFVYNNTIVDDKKSKQLSKNDKHQFNTYINYCKIFINNIIDNNIKISEENDDENKDKDIYIKIYRLLYDIDFNINVNYYHDTECFKNFNKEQFQEDKKMFENKLKNKLKFLSGDLYSYLDKKHQDSDYDYFEIKNINDDVNKIENPMKISKKSKSKRHNHDICDKKNTDVFDYILTELSVDDWQYDENKNYYKAVRKITFAKYMFNIYKSDREYLNEQNIDKFMDLCNLDVFIDLNNINNQNMLKNIINEKILNDNEIDKSILLKITPDETTMKNALLNNNYDIIDHLLNNKYTLSQNDFMYIRLKMSDKTDKDYPSSFDTYIKPILDKFASYNMYMEKDTLIKFCINNDFSKMFNKKLLKDYTIYKNESDKEFDLIIKEINEIKDITKVSNCYHIDCKEIQKYINKLKKSNKIISKDDLYLCGDMKMRYLFDELFASYDLVKKTDLVDSNSNIVDTDNKPKKIIKKIIKKVVKKKSDV